MSFFLDYFWVICALAHLLICVFVQIQYSVYLVT